MAAPGPASPPPAKPVGPTADAPPSARSDEKAKTPGAPSSNALLEIAKQIIQIAGVIGGGTTGLAALSFAIGYLAVKSHDAMLGLPTVSTSATTYVRTGALFFSNTLQNLSALPRPTLGQFVGVLVVSALLAFLALRLGRWASGRQGGEALVHAGVYLGLVATLIFYLPIHLAPLDRENRDLLINQETADHPDRGGLAHEAAHRINTKLTRDQDAESLLSIYALQCLATVVAAYWTVVMIAWRRRLARDTAPHGPYVNAIRTITDNVSRPLAIALTAVLVSTLPAVYGVLAISNSYPCVTLYKDAPSGPPEAIGAGFLVSDLSAEPDTVTILERKPNVSSYVDHFYARSSIRKIEITQCGNRSILAPR